MNEQQAEIRHQIGRGGSFALRTVAGNVHVRGADTDEAVVVARGASGRTPRLNVERGDGSLAIDLPRVSVSFFGRGIGSADADLEFDVELPRDARINISSVNAAITARDLTGEQAYRTVSGDLSLTGFGGRVSARSVSGDIRLRDGRKVELDVTTTSGDVDAEADEFEQFHVRSVSGDVEASAALRAGPRHSVETVSGDLCLHAIGGVTVEPARALDIGRQGRRPVVVGDGSAHLHFRSMSGQERVSAHPGHAGHAAHAGHPGGAEAHPDADGAPPRAAATPVDRMSVLRALERGEIDVDEAARQLEEVGSDA